MISKINLGFTLEIGIQYDKLVEYENQENETVLHCGIVVYYNQNSIIRANPNYLEHKSTDWLEEYNEIDT